MMKNNELSNRAITLLMSAFLFITPAIVFAADEHKQQAKDDKSAEHHNGHDKHGDHGHHHDHDHGDHTESHHGGIVSTADGFHHELVLTEEGKIIFYAEGLPTDEELKKITVRLIILSGKEKQNLEMVLDEEDNHRFEVPITKSLTANDKVVAMINMGAKKTRMVRFEITSD